MNTGWDFANAADPDDPAYLDSLMPWSESLPAGIRLKPKGAGEAARMADDPIICPVTRKTRREGSDSLHGGPRTRKTRQLEGCGHSNSENLPSQEGSVTLTRKAWQQERSAAEVGKTRGFANPESAWDTPFVTFLCHLYCCSIACGCVYFAEMSQCECANRSCPRRQGVPGLVHTMFARSSFPRVATSCCGKGQVVPEISRFYGIVVTMYAETGSRHSLPHIHVRYGEMKAVYSLQGELLQGSLPTKQKRLLLAWMSLHEQELQENWYLAMSKCACYRIPPLK